MSTVTAVPLQPVKRGYLLWLWAGILLALITAVALARQGDPALLREQRGAGVMTTASGLQYKVIKAGEASAPHPTDQDVALVQYRGRLLDGAVFDQSQRPTPLPLRGVVPGFSEALKLMRKGAVYRIWMPPKLGYGDQGSGPIPPNSTLVFDVELIDALPESVLQQMQARQQLMGQGGGGNAGEQPAAQ